MRCSTLQSIANCADAMVAVRVDDVAPNGYTLDRATVRQKKTGRPVRFELTEQTRLALDEYLRATGRKAGDFLFAGRGGSRRGLTTRQYARLVGEWIGSIGLDPLKFGTHSLRRTKATLIYRRTGNLRAVQLLLGHRKSTAPCAILVSRLTMPSRLQRKSTSEISGQSGRALPIHESSKCDARGVLATASVTEAMRPKAENLSSL